MDVCMPGTSFDSKSDFHEYQTIHVRFYESHEHGRIPYAPQMRIGVRGCQNASFWAVAGSVAAGTMITIVMMMRITSILPSGTGLDGSPTGLRRVRTRSLTTRF